MKEKQLKLSSIKPYPENPRSNDMAVDAVKQSILNYGYNQPIVVDKSNTIIVGHTRLKALKQLVKAGHEEFERVTVLESDLDAKSAREHRIADNKTNEASVWDLPYLRAELMESEQAQEFFPEETLKTLLGEVQEQPDWEISDDEIERQRRRMERYHEELRLREEEGGIVKITCNSCRETYPMGRKTAINNIVSTEGTTEGEA